MPKMIEKFTPIVEAMKKGPSVVQEIKKVPVTAESIGALRARAYTMAETKGMDVSALEAQKYLRQEASKKELYSDVVDLWHQQAIVGKHLVRAGEILPASIRKYTRPIEHIGKIWGTKLMLEAVQESDKLIQEHPNAPGMDFLKRRQGRFRGDVYIQQGRFVEALVAFDESINYFDELKDPEQLMTRANILELQGFKADALIRLGEFHNLKAGIQLALNTYNEYETKPEGQLLKEQDFARWISWRAGCMGKMTRALLDGQHLDNLLEHDRQRILDTVQEVYKAGAGTPGFEDRQAPLTEFWQAMMLRDPSLGKISD